MSLLLETIAELDLTLIAYVWNYGVADIRFSEHVTRAAEVCFGGVPTLSCRGHNSGNTVVIMCLANSLQASRRWRNQPGVEESLCARSEMRPAMVVLGNVVREARSCRPTSAALVAVN